ncbi:MAG TPA: hypothetical protein VFF73_00380, partial [Planctomycetota bacterium]|nr:hypothetical protein [Planctomycetota bacterium]
AAAGPPIDEWKVEDDKKTVGGKEFTCKKYTGKLKEKAGGGGMGMDGKLTLWITDTTKGWGLIAMTMKGSQNAQGMNIDFNMDVELKGYGNGDTADFGKKPADDSADDEGDDDSDDAPKAKDKKDDDKKDEKKDDSKKDEKKDKKKDDKDD